MSRHVYKKAHMSDWMVPSTISQLAHSPFLLHHHPLQHIWRKEGKPTRILFSRRYKINNESAIIIPASTHFIVCIVAIQACQNGKIATLSFFYAGNIVTKLFLARPMSVLKSERSGMRCVKKRGKSTTTLGKIKWRDLCVLDGCCRDPRLANGLL